MILMEREEKEGKHRGEEEKTGKEKEEDWPLLRIYSSGSSRLYPFSSKGRGPWDIGRYFHMHVC